MKTPSATHQTRSSRDSMGEVTAAKSSTSATSKILMAGDPRHTPTSQTFIRNNRNPQRTIRASLHRVSTRRRTNSRNNHIDRVQVRLFPAPVPEPEATRQRDRLPKLQGRLPGEGW